MKTLTIFYFGNYLRAVSVAVEKFFSSEIDPLLPLALPLLLLPLLPLSLRLQQLQVQIIVTLWLLLLLNFRIKLPSFEIKPVQTSVFSSLCICFFLQPWLYFKRQNLVHWYLTFCNKFSANCDKKVEKKKHTLGKDVFWTNWDIFM